MNVIKKVYLHRFLAIFLLTVIIVGTMFQGSIVLAESQVPKFHKNKLMVHGKDSESIVFLIVGDGFQKDEQELFNKKAKELEEYIITTSPFSKMKKYMNFYTLNVISKESGAADNRGDLKDTYFQSSYNFEYNIERLLAPTNLWAAYDLANYYVPDFDYILMLVNDERYGGSGGAIPSASINTASYEIMLHEMGHTIGSLADEYWAGSQYATETSNMTQEKNPKKVPWSDLIGQNGIGVYPYSADPTWYHPSKNCKMEYLGKEYPFCEVCVRTLKSKLQDLRWQTNSVYTYVELLSKITVTPLKKTLYVGGTTGKSTTIKAKFPAILHQVNSLTKTVVDVDRMEVKLTYKSSNPQIAQVSTSGKITAKSKGSTVITVTAQLANGTSKKLSFNLKVLEAKLNN